MNAGFPFPLTISPANHRPANFRKYFFFSQVELMRINFRFEAPIIQVHVQIITYIIY